MMFYNYFKYQMYHLKLICIYLVKKVQGILNNNVLKSITGSCITNKAYSKIFVQFDLYTSCVSILRENLKFFSTSPLDVQRLNLIPIFLKTYPRSHPLPLYRCSRSYNLKVQSFPKISIRSSGNSLW